MHSEHLAPGKTLGGGRKSDRFSRVQRYPKSGPDLWYQAIWATHPLGRTSTFSLKSLVILCQDPLEIKADIIGGFLYRHKDNFFTISGQNSTIDILPSRLGFTVRLTFWGYFDFIPSLWETPLYRKQCRRRFKAWCHTSPFSLWSAHLYYHKGHFSRISGQNSIINF
jgi:hypothetical protein